MGPLIAFLDAILKPIASRRASGVTRRIVSGSGS